MAARAYGSFDVPKGDVAWIPAGAGMRTPTTRRRTSLYLVANKKLSADGHQHGLTGEDHGGYAGTLLGETGAGGGRRRQRPVLTPIFRSIPGSGGVLQRNAAQLHGTNTTATSISAPMPPGGIRDRACGGVEVPRDRAARNRGRDAGFAPRAFAQDTECHHEGGTCLLSKTKSM